MSVGHRGIVWVISVLALCVVCFVCDYSSCLCDVRYGTICHDMILITFAFNCAMGPWSPIFPLNHYSRSYGDRNKIFGSTFVFVILGLSFYYHFVMFLITIYTNWWSINYWHYASDWVVKQYSCRAGEFLSKQCHTSLQQGYVQITTGIKAIL